MGYLAGYRCDVAYLHDSAQMAHRDIKPSNILIYEDLVAGGDLVLKLTDFGLSIDLTNALTWEHGSLALQSAWRHDSPESRRMTPNVGATTTSSEKVRIPSARDLLGNDMWKLGCVFTEMITFLVHLILPYSLFRIGRSVCAYVCVCLRMFPSMCLYLIYLSPVPLLKHTLF